MQYTKVALLLLSAAAQSNVMQTVPVGREGWNPLDTIKAAFKLEVDALKKVTAGLEFTPAFPTINLANFPGIDVNCVGDAIKLTFDDIEKAKEANQVWSAVQDLHFLVSHEVQCNGVNETLAFQVAQIALDGNDLIVNHNPKEVHSLVNDFKLLIAHVHSAKSSNIFDWFNWNSEGKVLTYSMDVNYANGQVTDKDIAIFQAPEAKVSCSDCYVHGDASVKIAITGTALKINSYEIDLTGDFKANMDVDLEIFEAHNQFLLRNKLFTKSLSAVTVGGLFSFAPEIVLESGISYSVTEAVDASYGFDFDFPFDYKISSTAKPSFTPDSKPKLTQHDLTVTKDIQVSASAHLIPSFVFDLDIFSLVDFNLDLALDTSLGLEFNTGKFKTCPTQSFDVALISESDVTLDVKSTKFDLFGVLDSSKIDGHHDICHVGPLTLYTFCKAHKLPVVTTTINKIGHHTTSTLSVATITDSPKPTTTGNSPQIVSTTTPTSPKAETTTPCVTTVVSTTESPKVKVTTVGSTSDSPKTQSTTTPCASTTDSSRVATTATPSATTAITTTDSPKTQSTTTPCATSTDSPKVETTTPCATTTVVSTTDLPKAQSTTTPCTTATVETTSDLPESTTTPCATTTSTTSDIPKAKATSTPCDTTADIPVTKGGNVPQVTTASPRQTGYSFGYDTNPNGSDSPKAGNYPQPQISNNISPKLGNGPILSSAASYSASLMLTLVVLLL